MLNPEELKLLVLFSEEGTLSRTAEKSHVSAPSVTRAMKHLEESFGAELFVRGKNSIELNETGRAAVEAARSILAEESRQIRAVREFDRQKKTVSVFSCAPAPLWDMLPRLSGIYPNKLISSMIADENQIKLSYENGECSYAILPFPYKDFTKLLSERLYVAVRKDSGLAGRSSVSFEELDGMNFLMRSELGYWERLCRLKLPNSKFLVQQSAFEFAELEKTSSLPCFATDIGVKHGFLYDGRVMIPVKDTEAVFYINRIDF